MRRLMLCLLCLTACTSLPEAAPDQPDQFDWLTGCWQSLDGETREVWSGFEHGYYFGYSVSASTGQPVFFEQMRIDPAPNPVFNAYPRGLGPTSFSAISIDAQAVTFANPEHDYPQKIRYWRDGSGLKAEISKMDGTRPGRFEFTPCSEDDETH